MSNILITMIYFPIVTILFIVWSEYSVGQILFRPNSTGKISINIGSMANFMINPLYKMDLWSLETLDINYVFIMISSFAILILSHIAEDINPPTE